MFFSKGDVRESPKRQYPLEKPYTYKYTPPKTNSWILKMMVSNMGISPLPGGTRPHFQVPAVSFFGSNALDCH